MRGADPAEHEQLGALTVAAYQALGVELGDYADVLRDVAGRAAHVPVLVAVADGRVVGGVTYVPGPDTPSSEFDDPDAAGVRFLAVAPDVQRRGIGRALLYACIERARGNGRRRVMLHTTKPMQAAQRMYDKEGFRRAHDHDLVVDSGVHLMAYVLELG